VEPALALPELATLVLPEPWRSLRGGQPKQQLEAQIIPEYLQSRRWFAGREAGIDSVSLELSQALADNDTGCLLTIFSVTLRDGSSQQYFLPLDVQWEDQERDPRLFIAWTLARVRSGSRPGFLLDALGDDLATGRLIAGFGPVSKGESCSYGPVRFSLTPAFPDSVDLLSAHITRGQEEQSNTSLRLGEHVILKAYRRLQGGIHPELEIGHFLTEVAGYANAAPLLGAIELVPDQGPPTALAVLQGFIPNQGDGWHFSLDYLSRYLDDIHLAEEPEAAQFQDHAGYLQLMETLGQRVAELHHAFAMPTEDPAFRAEEISRQDRDYLLLQIGQYTDSARASLQALRGSDIAPALTAAIDRLLQQWTEIDRLVETLLPERPTALRTRCHGDLHLGQVLLAEQDFFIVDFEGEPMRPLAERRAKQIPLRDLAGLLRSIDYAGDAAAKAYHQRHAENTDRDIRHSCRQWCQLATRTLLDSYRNHIQGCRSCPVAPEEFDRLVALFMLEKACYEIIYEANHRPAWADIPIAGLLNWLEHCSEVGIHG
jgi:maltose alpha-D-glucosyltransferase/alpha-amylase